MPHEPEPTSLKTQIRVIFGVFMVVVILATAAGAGVAAYQRAHDSRWLMSVFRTRSIPAMMAQLQAGMDEANADQPEDEQYSIYDSTPAVIYMIRKGELCQEWIAIPHPDNPSKLGAAPTGNVFPCELFEGYIHTSQEEVTS